MRPADKLADSVAQAEEAGFEVMAASPLRVVVRDGEDFDLFLDVLDAGEVDAVVLTSTTGVESLVELMARRGRTDVRRAFASCRRIAIGPLTGKAMAAAGLPADLMPKEHSSEGLVRELGGSLSGRKVSLLRSSHGEQVLFDGLQEAGCAVREVVLYDLLPQPDSPEMLALAKASMDGRVDAFAFTSSLSAATFIEAAERFAGRDAVVEMLNSRLVAAMGGPTRKRLEQMGISVGVVPPCATFEALLQQLRSEI